MVIKAIKFREFIASHPIVYLSTHTPLGVENLEKKAVVDLNNPPASIPVGENHLQNENRQISVFDLRLCL